MSQTVDQQVLDVPCRSGPNDDDEQQDIWQENHEQQHASFDGDHDYDSTAVESTAEVKICPCRIKLKSVRVGSSQNLSV